MPANQPFWNDNVDNGSTLWSLLTIADVNFQGFVTITGGVSRDIQKKKPKGADGARITDNGYNLAEMNITLTIVRQQEWDDFQNVLLPLIHPRRKGGPRSPVVIQHPALNVLGVSRIYFERIGLPVVDSKGIGTVSMDAIEWAPAPKDVKKAAGRGATVPDAGNAGAISDPALLSGLSAIDAGLTDAELLVADTQSGLAAIDAGLAATDLLIDGLPLEEAPGVSTAP